MAKIVWAEFEDVVRFYGPIEFIGRWVGKAVKRNMAVIGFGGLLEQQDGTWLAFLEVPKAYRKPSIYRHVVQGVAKAKADGATVIKALCDESIPGADRLLRHLGFEPTGETVDDKVVWIWQN